MYLGCWSTLMKTYKDTLPFLDPCLATFRIHESRYPANNLKSVLQSTAAYLACMNDLIVNRTPYAISLPFVAP